MEVVYLSRRNLQTLLNKLDRNKEKEYKESLCTIVKIREVGGIKQNKTLLQSMPHIAVVAVEDDLYYADRPPSPVHPWDTP